MEDAIKTLSAEEPDEPPYFAYSATLRIFGGKLNFEEIEANLGVTYTSAHRKGKAHAQGLLHLVRMGGFTIRRFPEIKSWARILMRYGRFASRTNNFSWI